MVYYLGYSMQVLSIQEIQNLDTKEHRTYIELFSPRKFVNAFIPETTFKINDLVDVI
jgi:hypothetical protein